MLNKKSILSTAKSALNHFKLKAEIKFLPWSSFERVALKSKLIKQVLDEGVSFRDLEIPALVYHESKEHIYLSYDILRDLVSSLPKTKQKDFIKSVIYHEAFHILHKHPSRVKKFKDCLKSEEIACNHFKKHYPKLYKLGYDIHKEATRL